MWLWCWSWRTCKGSFCFITKLFKWIVGLCKSGLVPKLMLGKVHLPGFAQIPKSPWKPMNFNIPFNGIWKPLNMALFHIKPLKTTISISNIFSHFGFLRRHSTKIVLCSFPSVSRKICMPKNPWKSGVWMPWNPWISLSNVCMNPNLHLLKGFTYYFKP